MPSYQDELVPIPVRIVDGSDLPASAKKDHKDVTFRTIVLSALNPVRALFAADLSRHLVVLQAFGNDAILCESQGKAQDAANQIAGLPNPEGFLLKASLTAAAPNAAFPPVYLPTTDLCWVTAQAFPSIITVCLINKVPG